MENTENESRPTEVPDFSTKTWKEDVVLLVEGKELHVAKNVMAYISPVFEAMFSHPFSEKEKSEIELPGKNYESFLEFMRCIYPGSERAITEDNIFQVLPLADEYQVKQLKAKCIKFLKQFIDRDLTTTQEILKCLALSERYHLDKIKDICVDKIMDKEPVEIVEAKFEPICKDTMLEILKRVVTQQNFLLVRHAIEKGMDVAVLERNFQNFTDAKGAVLVFELNDVSEHMKRNCVVDKSPSIEIWSFTFFVFVRYGRINNKSKFGIFLKVDPPENASEWSCTVKGRLILKNTHSEDLSRKIEHTFTAAEDDWGFADFAEVSDVLDPKKGFINGDKVKIAAAFLANKPDWTEFSD